jgi:hypothetical protein
MRRRNRELERHMLPGWRIAGITGGDHLRLVKRGCTPVYVAASPSDHRWLRNAVGDMRRSERVGSTPSRRRRT